MSSAISVNWFSEMGSPRSAMHSAAAAPAPQSPSSSSSAVATTNTLHVAYRPGATDRGNLYAFFRSLPGFRLVGFYDTYCFVRFADRSYATLALATQPFGCVTYEPAKLAYEVPYPQPQDDNVPPCKTLHVTHLPPNYSKEEIHKIFRVFDGFLTIQLHGKYGYAYFANESGASEARAVLRAQTNLVVSFAKNAARNAYHPDSMTSSSRKGSHPYSAQGPQSSYVPRIPSSSSAAAVAAISGMSPGKSVNSELLAAVLANVSLNSSATNDGSPRQVKPQQHQQLHQQQQQQTQESRYHPLHRHQLHAASRLDLGSVGESKSGLNNGASGSGNLNESATATSAVVSNNNNKKATSTTTTGAVTTPASAAGVSSPKVTSATSRSLASLQNSPPPLSPAPSLSPGSAYSDYQQSWSRRSSADSQLSSSSATLANQSDLSSQGSQSTALNMGMGMGLGGLGYQQEVPKHYQTVNYHEQLLMQQRLQLLQLQYLQKQQVAQMQRQNELLQAARMRKTAAAPGGSYGLGYSPAPAESAWDYNGNNGGYGYGYGYDAMTMMGGQQQQMQQQPASAFSWSAFDSKLAFAAPTAGRV